MNAHLDWKSFLKQHPVFSPLDLAEIEDILAPEHSSTLYYDQNRTVIRTGESGDSFFLIGSGSLQVALPEADNKMIPLKTIRKGEFFGEIAVFNHAPPFCYSYHPRTLFTIRDSRPIP